MTHDGTRNRMPWCTTASLDKFLSAASGYLISKAAENTVLLSAAYDLRGTNPLFGWWEPSEGTQPRGAFLHAPPAPLLIAGGAPETAAALAASLARAGRYVCGVDAPTGAADAFAAAWSRRAGVGVRVHRQSRVYRLTGTVPDYEGPPGRPRIATRADRDLLIGWLRAFRGEVGQFTGAPETAADDLIGYGGATFWETGECPVAMASVTRPVARVVQVSIVYTPPDRRGHGYATAVMLAVARAELAAHAREVVMITDAARPLRRASRLGYQLIGERAMLSFGPSTGPILRVPTGPILRVPTGPMPRLREY
jgi:predicted GNAT family acetyltransferase